MIEPITPYRVSPERVDVSSRPPDPGGAPVMFTWVIRWMEAVENDTALHRVDVVTRPASHHATMSCDGRSHLEAFCGRNTAARLS